MGDSFHIYKDPEPNHTYVMTVDVAEGLNQDYSTFSIIDVTYNIARNVTRNVAYTSTLNDTINYSRNAAFDNAKNVTKIVISNAIIKVLGNE